MNNFFYKVSSFKISIFLTIFFILFLNASFFSELINIYPLNIDNIVFLVFLSLNITLVFFILFNLIRVKYLFKPLVIFIFLLSSLAAYVMHSFGTPVDSITILNIVNTDMAEMRDLISLGSVTFFIAFGVFPSLLLFLVPVDFEIKKKRALSVFKVVIFSLIFIISNVALQSKSYATFFREHKFLRSYVNPVAWIYAIEKYSANRFKGKDVLFKKKGQDSILVHEKGHYEREIIIFVVGETVRSDHVSLNGYQKTTFPLLAKQDVFSFTNMSSCGTSTAVSVPCMFSDLTRKTFDSNKAKNSENIMDILKNTKGVKTLWRDNNSDSKGVAVRVDYQNYRDPSVNTICDDECRDVGMLVGLEDLINSEKKKDIFIVLHQMGNHGPAYYKRYPKEFEVFKPACKTNELNDCTNDEIINAYDNVLVYTDFFLNQVIELLKKYPQDETAMLYISDHGESLGENGIYLHGMPYMLAPKEQTHVPAIVWFGGGYLKELNKEFLLNILGAEVSHDFIFHSLLGLFEAQTILYDRELDLFNQVIDHSN